MPALTSPARSRALTLLLSILAAALAGCGSSSVGPLTSRSASEILAAAKAAAESASSVHVVTQIGQGRGSASSTVDLAGSHGGRGQFSLGRLGFELILIESTLYVLGNPAYNAQLGSRAAHLARGTWLKASATGGPLSGLATTVSQGKLLEALLAGGGATSKGSTTTVNGQRAVEVTQGLYSVFVATSGKPYPIEVTKSGALLNHTTFSHWNEPVSLSPPPKTIDVGQVLTGG
jgi:hypothetical protein